VVLVVMLVGVLKELRSQVPLLHLQPQGLWG
jgi:hypothetical protein